MSKKSPWKDEYYCSFTDFPLGFKERHYLYIFRYGFAHLIGSYGLFKLFTFQYPWPIYSFTLFYGIFNGLGVTMGAHRYWTHKSFKANFPLRILMAWMQTTSAQSPIFRWCKEHRVHHKYVDTEADPYNSRLGFWHAHIGWLFKPEPATFQEKARTIDMSDLDNDPIVRFQAKYYWSLLMPLTAYIIPISIIRYMCPELSLLEAFRANYCWYILTHHSSWLVNSAAHLWGYRPYDKTIDPRDNKLVAMLSMGEGWHNYHHVFPWDYKTAEIGAYHVNLTALFLDFFAWIGWAYDLKTVPSHVIKHRMRRTGDGSIGHGTHNKKHKEDASQDILEDLGEMRHVWGWGDKDIPQEHVRLVHTIKPSLSSVPSGFS